MKKKKLRLKRRVKYFFIILGVIIIYIIYQNSDYAKMMKKKEEAREIIEEIQKENVDNMFDNLIKLHETNKDLAGYLIIPDTNINYPVMYTPNEDYYLRRSFQKSYSISGTLYIDKHNKIDPRDTNLIIHGHNMEKEQTMFHELEKFKEEEFYQNHQTFTYYTLKEKEDYEIVAVFLSEVYKKSDQVFKYYQFFNANTLEELERFNSNIKKLSLYDTKRSLNFGDELLTLSTCEYSKENGRLVVVARKINKYS